MANPVVLGGLSFTDQVAAAFYPSLVQRVELAAVAVALAVHSEDPATVGHDLREGFGRVLLANPAASAVAIVWAVVADGVTGVSSTDAELVDRVWSIWSALAGSPALSGPDPVP